MGWMYHHGSGVTRNIAASIEWYKKSASRGHTIAQYILGVTYEEEDGFKDLQKAVNWYQKAADNHKGAEHKLKELNDNGCFAEEEQNGVG